MDFEKHLMQEYPALFCENKAGELECACGAWVPLGWQGIVLDLCASINSHVKGSYRTQLEVTSCMFYFWRTCIWLLNWSHQKFLKLFPQCNAYELNKTFYKFVEKFRQRYYKCCKYNKIYPPSVQIDQIKEKFGGLRFYYTGGDEQIRGMVYMAEYLCSKTCEVTGQPGTLCSRGGWLKTLSAEILEQQPYVGYIPLK